MIVGHADYDHWDKAYASQFESVIMPAAAKQLLMAGVTSARDLGAPLEASIAVRNRINSGKIPGATLYVSGPFIQHAPYPDTESYRWGVNGPDDGRAKVKQDRRRRRRRRQADRSGPDDDGGGARGGGRSAPARQARRRARSSARRDPPRPCGRRRLLRAHGAGDRARSIPTTSSTMIRERTAKMSPRAALLDADDRRAAQLRIPARQPGSARRSGVARGSAGRDRRRHQEVARASRPPALLPADGGAAADARAQVQAAAGRRRHAADRDRQRHPDELPQRTRPGASSTPGSTTLGVDPITAIRAATYWPSVAMKVDREVGTVSAGKYADIIAVRGDVLRYISLLQRVDVVIKHGTRYK